MSLILSTVLTTSTLIAFQDPEAPQGHTGWVTAVTVAQLDGADRIISASGDNTVRVWDLDHPDTRVALHFVDDERAIFGP